MGALSGVRICDFSWALAGPSATMMLACLGAEVIKIETRTRLDVTRHGNGFDATNREKKAITLNMRHPRAIELAKEVAVRSTAVMENFRPGVMEDFGLGYGTLRELKPDLIMLSCSIAGGKGPYARYAGYAPLFVALSGLGELVGYEDGPPTEIRIASDIIVGVTNAVALLGAIIHHQRTGQGIHVDVSAVEALASMAGDSFLDYTINGRVQTRQGNDDVAMAPHNCYRCAGEDSWVSIAVGTQEEWQALVRAVGSPEWAADRRFRHALGRSLHREELDRRVEAWTRQRSSNEVMRLLQGAGVAAVPSFKAPDLFGDPHLKERVVTASVDSPSGETLQVVRPGGKLSKTPYVTEKPGPAMGEHNTYVLCDIVGLSTGEVRALEEEGVLQ